MSSENKLEKHEVEKIAQLARIELTEAEKEKFTVELSAILGWVEQLNEVDTDNIPETHNISGIELPMRKDEVKDDNISEKILLNAPKSEYNCFAVPKVIE